MFLALSVYIGKSNSSFPSNNDQSREKPKSNRKTSLGSESYVTIAILAVPSSLDNLVMATDSPLVLAVLSVNEVMVWMPHFFIDCHFYKHIENSCTIIKEVLRGD